jgi:hypothetical protein
MSGRLDDSFALAWDFFCEFIPHADVSISTRAYWLLHLLSLASMHYASFDGDLSSREDMKSFAQKVPFHAPYSPLVLDAYIEYWMAHAHELNIPVPHDRLVGKALAWRKRVLAAFSDSDQITDHFEGKINPVPVAAPGEGEDSDEPMDPEEAELRCVSGWSLSLIG